MDLPVPTPPRIAAAAALVLFLAGCTHFASLFSSAPDWLLFDVTPLRDYYYNASGIERLSERVVKVRISAVAKGSEGRDWEVKERMKRGLGFGGYERYESSQDTYVLDCEGKEYRLLEGADYNDKGDVLSSYERPDSPWEPVPSGSVLGTLIAFKSVCP